MIKKSYEVIKNPINFIKCNLFLLYGENNGIKNDIAESIKSLIKQKKIDIEEFLIYENEIIEEEENLYNSIYSGSLFTSNKLIKIKNGTDKILKYIEDISERCPKNITIIIFSELLDKKSKLRSFFEKNLKNICIPCYLDNERDLHIIAGLELKKENIFLSRESINLLVEKSNSDRGNLKNEIEKIISFSLNNKNLDIEQIKSIINFSGEYKSDTFINECLCGNILQFKKILTELYVGTINQIFLLRILNNKISRLLNMKEISKNKNDIDNLINTSKPPIFWKEKPIVKKQLDIWNYKDLKQIIIELNETEILCKKYPNTSKVIFFNFLNKLCSKASSYS